MKAVCLAPVLAALIGCSGSGPQYAPNTLLASENRLSSSAPIGPRALEASPFEYQALPWLTSVKVTEGAPGATFSFRPGKSGPELNMTGDLVAEIEVGTHRTAPSDIDLSGGTRRDKAYEPGRYYHVFRQVDDTGPFAWTPASGAASLCGRNATGGRARWQGYVHGSRSDEGLVYLCYEGPFDPESCSAKADRAWRAVARSVVGNAVFGFRSHDGDCSPPALVSQERLTLVGPRPLWIGSSAPLTIHSTDGGRSFTRLALPVGRTVASSAVIDTRPLDVQVIRGERAQYGGPSTLSYSVEVVWARTDPAPSAIGFVSVLGGHAGAADASTLSQIAR